MKIETSTVKKLIISDVPHLDPITIFLEDLEPRKGKATITCYNESWTSYWGGMGDRTIAEFILSCDEGYLAKNFAGRIDHSIVDLEGLGDIARKEIMKDRRKKNLDKDRARDLYESAEDLDCIEHEQTLFDCHGLLMSDIFGEEWWYGLPTIPNPKYTYLCKILTTVKTALKECV